MADTSVSDDFSVNQFSCPVCLDLLKDPVTAPCGHSFCKVCINGCWDQEDVKYVYSCPQCKETFPPRLNRNNMLAELVEKLKKTELQAASPAHCYAGPADVECDSCTGRKHKAVKSCLVCQVSYCKDHLQPHFQSPAFKKHKLVKARAELQEEVERPKKQSFPSLCVSPGCEDFTVDHHLSFDGVKNFSLLKKQVEEFCQEEFNKARQQAAAIRIILPSEPKSREDFFKYFCYLTLDPNTAHRKLILFEENRAVARSDTDWRYSDHPERFDSWSQVLCKESVCGCCYWEVEWIGHVYISVSYKKIRRKGWGDECEFGSNTQSWSLECSPSSVFFRHNNNQTELRGPVSPRIGVYVDHSAGTLSFYSISDTMRLLHRVHTTITQPLYAGVWMWNSDTIVRFCDQK